MLCLHTTPSNRVSNLAKRVYASKCSRCTGIAQMQMQTK